MYRISTGLQRVQELYSGTGKVQGYKGRGVVQGVLQWFRCTGVVQCFSRTCII